MTTQWIKGDNRGMIAKKRNRISDRAVQIYLSEYNEHVHNIRDRVQLEQTILNYTVFLTAAMIPASIQIVDHRAFVAFFFVPPVFAILAVLALRQDFMIAAIAEYVHCQLAPRLRRAALDDDAFRLEEALFTLRKSANYVPAGIARYALFGLPSICALIAIPYLKIKFNHHWTATDSVLATLDFLLIVATGSWIAWVSSASYDRITQR